MKFRVWREGEFWWLYVPPRMRLGRESGTYGRRTFAEVVTLMDFYASRAHARIMNVVRDCEGPHEMSRQL